VALVLLPSLPAAAGEAALEGKVLDPSGRPVAGALVLVREAGGGTGSFEVTAGTDGAYRVSGLVVGVEYIARAWTKGHDPGNEVRLIVEAGKVTTRNLFVTPHVADDRWYGTIGFHETATTTTFSGELIEGLPLLGRHYQDVLSLSPGVTDVWGDGNPNVNGAREGELQILLDGADATDPVTGSFAQNLSLEAVESLDVISTGFSAMYGRAQGGFAPLRTRSSGNDLEGSVKLFYRSDLLDGDGANNNDITQGDVTPNGEFDSLLPFFSLGGPVVRDHLWYFLALQYISTDFPVRSLGGVSESTDRGWNAFLKLSWEIHPDHRLAASVNYDPREFDGLGLASLVDEKSGYDVDQGGTLASLRWTWTPSPSLRTEVLFSHLDTGLEIRPGSSPGPCPLDGYGNCDPFQEDVYTVGNDGHITGPYYLTQDDERRRDLLRADFSFFFEARGMHILKAGFEVGEEEYESTPEQDPIRIDNFTPYGPSGTVSFVEAFPASQRLEAEKDLFGVYLQDLVRPRGNVTIQVGVRFDREEIETDGWDPLDSEQEAEDFLDLYSLGSGIPAGNLNLHYVMSEPWVQFDINGDGRDFGHCNSQFPLDRYDNSLVTGFTIDENGTYVLVGDDADANGNGIPDFQEPDGIEENFFLFVDGGGALRCQAGLNAGGACETDEDCPSPLPGFFFPCVPGPDGTASFDPSLAGMTFTDAGHYGDPAAWDTVFFDPEGGQGFSDSSPANPNCDRLGDDTFHLFSVYSRHQHDLEEGPVDFPRGGLAGTFRGPDRFEITNNNLAPRVSIAWDPWSDGKSKIFGTWGRYFGTLQLGPMVVESGPDVRTYLFDARAMQYGSRAEPISVSRFSVRRVDRDLKTPFTDEWTIGFQRVVALDWILSVRYVHRDGRNQLQDVDHNHYTQDSDGDGQLDDAFGRIGTTPYGGITREPDGLPDLYVYNPLFHQVLELGNFNSSEYESYQLEAVRRLARRWQMSASYVYSKAEGDAERWGSLAGNDPGQVGRVYADLDFDHTHAVKVTALGFLPGHQTLGGILQWRSGLPYSLVDEEISFDSQNRGMLRTTYPSGQRNSERNEGVWTVNLAYRKQFTFEGVQAGLGVEVENLLNSDDLHITSVDRTAPVNPDIYRRFGRRWQVGLELHF
jgi:hypothetical protein